MTIRNIILAAAGGAGLPKQTSFAIPSRGDTTWGGTTTDGWPDHIRIAGNSTIAGTSTIVGSQRRFPNSVAPYEGILAGFTASNGLNFSNNPWTWKGSQMPSGGTLFSIFDIDNTGNVYAYSDFFDPNNRRVFVNVRNGGVTTTIAISRPITANASNWGKGIALSGNAQYLFVAAPTLGTTTNEIYVFVANNATPTLITNYTYQATLTTGIANDGSNLGGTNNNLKASTDGSWLVAGGITGGNGVVATWSRGGSVWTRRTVINAPGGRTNYGKAVTISGNATYLAFSYDESSFGVGGTGFINIMSLNASLNWTFVKTLIYTPTGATQATNWGSSIAMNNFGSKLAVSNYNEGIINIYSGLGTAMQFDSNLGFQSSTLNDIVIVDMNLAGTIVIGDKRFGGNAIEVWNI